MKLKNITASEKRTAIARFTLIELLADTARVTGNSVQFIKVGERR